MTTFIKQWIVALRSGNYTQAYGQLDTGCSCCAIGVACRLMGDQLEARTVPNGSITYDHHGRTPPEKVVKAIGLPMDILSKVMWMNDRQQRSFPEIADYLETVT